MKIKPSDSTGVEAYVCSSSYHVEVSLPVKENAGIVTFVVHFSGYFSVKTMDD